MYKDIAQLIMYQDMDQNSILMRMSDIFRRYDLKESDNATITREIYTEIKRLLVVATDYAFDENLWQNYLTFILITQENPFSLTCEKVGASEGTVNTIVKNDFSIFRKLFHYDFSKIESELGINCFT